MKNKNILLLILLTGLLYTFSSCGDSFLTPESTDVMTESEIEELKKRDPAAGLIIAEGYLGGAYKNIPAPTWNVLQRGHDDFGLRAVMLATDCMVDDITIPQAFFFGFDYQNENRSATYRRTRSTWAQNYSLIYAANNALRMLEPADLTVELPADVADALGQALAIRAYSYFILINMFQQPYSVNKEALGVPIHTSKSEEARPGRNTVREVYELILSDLTRSYEYLEKNGASSSPTVMNKYNVAGMLARVLQFVNDYPSQWSEVAKYADLATKGNSLLTSETEFTSGFNSVDMNEVIWGSKINAETTTFYASFMSSMDPYQIGYAGMGNYIMIADGLYNKIDPQDLRYKWWLAQDITVGTVANPKVIKKYTQVKYIDRGGFTSDYIYMRTAEMYYIKAEALFLNNDEAGARSTLEEIMKTRLTSYSAASKTGTALLEEIRLQKRVDLWADGSRLFDMKWRQEALDRTTSTNHVQNYTLKLPVNPKEWVYQIPTEEMDANDFITENNP